jgi:glycosyltransferase involved in cell wall biosynthesis
MTTFSSKPVERTVTAPQAVPALSPAVPRRLRIVHLITGLGTGGAETMLEKLLNTMDRSRFDNRVVSLSTEGVIGPRLRAHGIEVTSLGMGRGLRDFAAMRKLGRVLRQFRPDVLQTWLYHSDLLGLIAGRLNRTPHIVWNVRCSAIEAADFSLASRITRWTLRPLSPFPSAVIFNSLAGAQVHQREGYSPRQVFIIPNGFDLSLFRPNPEARAAMRREFGFESKTLVIGHVGRFHPMKDYRSLLNALAKVCAQYADVRAILAGASITLDNEWFRHLFSELQLGGRIQLLGERSDIPRLANAFDIAVLSSYSEGFPNVIGEAMACGVPCVATDVGDARWIIGETGRIVPAQNSDALAKGIEELIQLGMGGRRQLGDAARERIAREFSLPMVVRKYENLYSQLVFGNANR